MIDPKLDLIPKMYRIKQNFNTPVLKNTDEEITRQMSQYLDKIKKGSQIGIAVGSRGIYNSKQIVKRVVEMVKKAGANPCIIPAMGSHGGATAEGQTKVLEGYGITEEYIGAPIKATMETVKIGDTPEGMPVYFDKNAASLDGIIMLNRVKPHTDFSGEIESGLMKQMAIGLGKQKGASQIHRYGIYGLKTLLPAAARVIMKNAPIIMGVAILENAEDTTAKIEVIPCDKIEEREKELLKEARNLLPSIPCFPLDVMVVQEQGKNISGTGMDPNVTGRYLIRGLEDDKEKQIYRVVCLDLTEESHHNALGVGLSDVITKRLFEKIDLNVMYMNVITSGFLERGFIPIIQENDREAINTALICCNRYITKENARMIIIKNTLELKEVLVSEALLNEVQNKPELEILGEEFLQWDAAGNLILKL